jgi:hypothetical protein
VAERNDLDGWSLRACGRYAGLSANAVTRLLRLDPQRDGAEDGASGPLSTADVLVVRTLSEMNATRPVNKAAADERTQRLARRDQMAATIVRTTAAAGPIRRSACLLAHGDTARLAANDRDVMSALLTTLDDHAGESVLVLPIGIWLEEIREAEALQQARQGATRSETGQRRSAS